MSRSRFSLACATLRALPYITLLSTAITVVASPAPTKTSLYISPGGTIYAGKVVNFKAWVSQSGNPVLQGIVLFCDATAPHCSDSHILAQAQLRASGTAQVNLIPPSGTHQIQAVFVGTKTAAWSNSAIQSLVVNGSPLPTGTSITGQGTAGNYSLIATVTSTGSPLTGKVSFPDATNGNELIAERTLSAERLVFVNLPSTAPASGTLQATADFNGDGRADQAIVSNNGEINILLGKGDGTFAFKTAIISGSTSPNVTVGDFNSDDIPDLVVVDEYNSTISILLGRGDGTFSASIPLSSVPTYPARIAIGDFNGDGIQDMFVAFQYRGVETLLGNGDGTFVAIPTAGTPGTSYPSQIALGDFNRDGNEDVALAGIGGAIKLLLGKGDGSFTAATSSVLSGLTCDDACPGVVSADFNGDGKTDLAIADRGELNNFTGATYMLIGNGDGTFTHSGDIEGQNFETLGVGDFNGDGIVDLAAGINGFPTTLAYLNNRTASFSDLFLVSSSSSNFLLADLNNDGKTDSFTGTPTATQLSEIQADASALGVGVPSGLTGTQQTYAQYEGNSSHQPSAECLHVSFPTTLTNPQR